MAVAARPPVAGNPTGLKAALITFVALTVVSLGLLIWLYTGQEQLSQATEASNKQAQAANQKEQETRKAMEALAVQIVGKQTEDAAEIASELDSKIAAIFGKDPARATDAQKKIVAEAGIKRNDPVLTTLKSMYDALTKQTEKFDSLQADFDKLKLELAAKTEEMKKTQEQFTAEADKIKADVADLEKQVMANRDAWDESVAKLRQQSQAQGERATEQLASERKQRQNLEQQLNQNKSRVNDLVTTLATFRPSAESTSLLQITDGYIVQTVPGERIVYIGLGTKDHVKPGMTFAVYSRVRGIPADGKGKATIRVNNVFDTTSECEVTTTTVGDPVMDGDIIANPVYDRNRKFNFVVAGDFDLNYDGKIDDPDGEQVRRMIQDWGGSLQKTVDTRTDFVVLGVAPMPPSTTGDNADEARAKQAAGVKAFDTIRQEAKSLGIPVLTRTQFLHFVGFGVPRNAKDDAN
jgi:hypothetical protein